jgi:hypothetical protein
MPGKKDGLYWEGESENLVPKSFADAAAAVVQGGGKMPAPYHGYYFHVLKAQGPDAPGGAMNYVVKGEMIGGFALVAWPAEYGVSGIKTLLVSHQGTVYEKDLGATTATLARAMTRFNPDKTWIAVEGEWANNSGERQFPYAESVFELALPTGYEKLKVISTRKSTGVGSPSSTVGSYFLLETAFNADWTSNGWPLITRIPFTSPPTRMGTFSRSATGAGGAPALFGLTATALEMKEGAVHFRRWSRASKWIEFWRNRSLAQFQL